MPENLHRRRGNDFGEDYIANYMTEETQPQEVANTFTDIRDTYFEQNPDLSDRDRDEFSNALQSQINKVWQVKPLKQLEFNDLNQVDRPQLTGDKVKDRGILQKYEEDLLEANSSGDAFWRRGDAARTVRAVVTNDFRRIHHGPEDEDQKENWFLGDDLVSLFSEPAKRVASGAAGFVVGALDKDGSKLAAVERALLTDPDDDGKLAAELTSGVGSTVPTIAVGAGVTLATKNPALGISAIGYLNTASRYNEAYRTTFALTSDRDKARNSWASALGAGLIADTGGDILLGGLGKVFRPFFKSTRRAEKFESAWEAADTIEDKLKVADDFSGSIVKGALVRGAQGTVSEPITEVTGDLLKIAGLDEDIRQDQLDDFLENDLNRTTVVSAIIGAMFGAGGGSVSARRNNSILRQAADAGLTLDDVVHTEVDNPKRGEFKPDLFAKIKQAELDRFKEEASEPTEDKTEAELETEIEAGKTHLDQIRDDLANVPQNISPIGDSADADATDQATNPVTDDLQAEASGVVSEESVAGETFTFNDGVEVTTEDSAFHKKGTEVFNPKNITKNIPVGSQVLHQSDKEKDKVFTFDGESFKDSEGNSSGVTGLLSDRTSTLTILETNDVSDTDRLRVQERKAESGSEDAKIDTDVDTDVDTDEDASQTESKETLPEEILTANNTRFKSLASARSALTRKVNKGELEENSYAPVGDDEGGYSLQKVRVPPDRAKAIERLKQARADVDSVPANKTLQDRPTRRLHKTGRRVTERFQRPDKPLSNASLVDGFAEITSNEIRLEANVKSAFITGLTNAGIDVKTDQVNNIPSDLTRRVIQATVTQIDHLPTIEARNQGFDLLANMGVLVEGREGDITVDNSTNNTDVIIDRPAVAIGSQSDSGVRLDVIDRGQNVPSDSDRLVELRSGETVKQAIRDNVEAAPEIVLETEKIPDGDLDQASLDFLANRFEQLWRENIGNPIAQEGIRNVLKHLRPNGEDAGSVSGVINDELLKARSSSNPRSEKIAEAQKLIDLHVDQVGKHPPAANVFGSDQTAEQFIDNTTPPVDGSDNEVKLSSEVDQERLATHFPGTLRKVNPPKALKELVELFEGFGLSIDFVEGDDLTEFQHGVYVPRDNKIIVNVNSNKLLSTVLGHEFFHHLESVNPDIARQLEASIDINPIEYDNYVNKRIRGKGNYTEADYRREVVAELFGEMISNIHAVERLNDLSTDNPTLLQGIAEALRSFIKRIERTYVKAYNALNKSFQKLNKDLDPADYDEEIRVMSHVHDVLVDSARGLRDMQTVFEAYANSTATKLQPDLTNTDRDFDLHNDVQDVLELSTSEPGSLGESTGFGEQLNPVELELMEEIGISHLANDASLENRSNVRQQLEDAITHNEVKDADLYQVNSRGRNGYYKFGIQKIDRDLLDNIYNNPSHPVHVRAKKTIKGSPSPGRLRFLTRRNIVKLAAKFPGASNLSRFEKQVLKTVVSEGKIPPTNDIMAAIDLNPTLFNKRRVKLDQTDYDSAAFALRQVEDIVEQETGDRPDYVSELGIQNAGESNQAYHLRVDNGIQLSTDEEFHSTAERVIETKMPAKAPVSQVKGLLANNGVKKSELEWLGIDEWLAGKDTVTKDEVLEYIRSNKIELSTSDKSGTDTLYSDITVNPNDAEAKNYREILIHLSPDGEPDHKSAHFEDDTNIAVWLRVDDRVDDNGDKVFFINEIQSDWAGDVRRADVRDSTEIDRLESDLAEMKEWLQNNKQLGSLNPEVQVVKDTVHDLQARLDVAKGAPTRMPFSRDYHKLAIKQAIKEASRGGYDRIAWPTGSQQIDSTLR